MHPIAAYVGSASQGLGFYHVEVPSVESTQWLNLTNYGVVKVLSGSISLSELEGELSEIYYRVALADQRTRRREVPCEVSSSEERS